METPKVKDLKKMRKLFWIEEEEEEGRREGLSLKSVYSLPLSMFFFLVMVVFPFLKMF